MGIWSRDDDGLPFVVNRRTVLRGGLLGGAGLAAAALIGCGDDDDDDGGEMTATATSTSTSEATETGTATATATEGGGETSQEGVTTPKGRFIPANFADPAGTPKAGGVLKQAVNWDVGPMDPTQSAAGGTIAPGRAAYNRVIGFVAGPDAKPFDPEIGPELASSWEQSDDGLSYTFHLKDGIRWQNVDPLNGRDFTSADVKYAWDRYAESGAQAQYWTNLSEITTPDPQTVVVTLNNPEPDFLTPLASRYLTIHPQEIVEDGTITSRAIGTGPFIQKEATPGERVVFEKNPDYFDGEVLLDGIEHLILPDRQTRLAQMRVEQVDTALSPTASWENLDELFDTNPDMLSTWTPNTNTYFALSLNLNDPRFQDERVRRALSLGMDRELIIELAYSGYGASTSTIPWLFLFDQRPDEASGLLGEWWKYDPEEATKQLQAAGQEGLAFTMIYYNYSQAQTSMAEVIAQNYKDISIDMTVGLTDYTEFNSQWIQHTYEEAADGWAANGFTPDNFFYNQLHSGASGNRYNIDDAQIDEWAEAQKVELDPDARKEIWRNIWDRVMDQVWRIDKPYGEGYDLYQPWLRGVRFTGALLTNYSFTEIGASPMIQNAWLDK